MYYYEDESTTSYDDEHVLQDVGEYVLPPKNRGKVPNSNRSGTPETTRQTQREVIQDEYDNDGHYSIARPNNCPTKKHGVLQKAASEKMPAPKEGFLQKKNVKIAAGVIAFLIIVGGILPLIILLTRHKGITHRFSFIYAVIVFTNASVYNKNYFLCGPEKTYCLRYETQKSGYADTEGVAELEVTLSDVPNCTMLFLIRGYKGTGSINTECQDAGCHSGIDTPQHVRIRQNSTDGWGIEKMEIQRYPGSSGFITYSLDGNHSQFWLDGNGVGDVVGCEYGNWCSLKIVDIEGKHFHIIIQPSSYFCKI